MTARTATSILSRNGGPDTPAAERRTAGVTFAARLTFDAIRHQYDSRETLCGISLSAEPGEVLCLLGPSGSGKTTLLRIAAGIEPQTSGSLFLNDREIAGPSLFIPPERRGIGLMFQDFALFPHMSILDNVRFGLTALTKADARAEALAALERVGLSHQADAYPHALSGGEQQRVALARALAPRPAVLLMDEPFSGLDSRLKDSVRAETLSILRETRATAIVVTHDAEEAMRMGDRIALMRDGLLEQVGTAEDLYTRPKTLFAAGFFSELNLFDTKVSHGAVDTPVGRFSAGDMREGASVSVAIRLTGTRITPAGGKTPARIISRRFLGVVELLTLAVPGSSRPLRARMRVGEIGSQLRDVTVSVNEQDILLFERKPEAS